MSIETFNDNMIQKRTYNNMSFEEFCIGFDNELGEIKKAFFPLKKDKKRLMFFSAHWFTGGVERFLSNLLPTLCLKYDIYLVTVETEFESAIKIPEAVSSIKVSEKVFYDKYDYALLALAYVYEIDVAIGCINLFNKVLDFYSLARHLNIKTIASNHEYYFYAYENHHFYPYVNKRVEVYKNIDAAVWETNFSAYVYNNYNSNGYVIPNPNTYEINAGHIESKKEKIVLCIGRFNDHINVKRIDRVLLCFSKVLTKVPDAILILIGKCDMNLPFIGSEELTILQFLNKLGIPEKNLRFADSVESVSVYYKKASVLIKASNSEGFPMVINEAACFGVPAVCNYIPGLEDIITEGENGYLPLQDDIDSMAEHVCNILTDNELRIRLSKNAAALAERFSAEKVGAQWEFLLETITSDRSNDEISSKLRNKLNKSAIASEQNSKNLCFELNKVIDIFCTNTYVEQISVCQECVNLKRTLSWRITRPLRAVGKVLHSLKIIP